MINLVVVIVSFLIFFLALYYGFKYRSLKKINDGSKFNLNRRLSKFEVIGSLLQLFLFLVIFLSVRSLLVSSLTMDHWVISIVASLLGCSAILAMEYVSSGTRFEKYFARL